MLFWMRWRRWFNGPILLLRPGTCCDSGYVGGQRTATTADQSSALIDPLANELRVYFWR